MRVADQMLVKVLAEPLEFVQKFVFAVPLERPTANNAQNKLDALVLMCKSPSHDSGVVVPLAVDSGPGAAVYL